MNDRLLDRTEVQERLGGISRSSFLRLVERGEFPPAIRISKRILRRSESIVERFLESKSPV